MTDLDHELVDRLLNPDAPRDSEVGALMDDVRARFLALGHHVVNHVPRTPDRTIALRSIHRACMDSIAAIACNQDAPLPS